MTQHHLCSLVEAWGQVVGPLWASTTGCSTMCHLLRRTRDSNDPGNSTAHASFRKQLLPHKAPYSLSNVEVNGNSP